MSAKSDNPPLPAPADAPDPEPDPRETYWSNALRDRPRIKPVDEACVLGVITVPTVLDSIVGVAYAYSHVGGMTRFTGPHDDYPPPEVIWRLVLDRVWVDGGTVRLEKKLTLDGRFVLRLGRFVELAEDAV